jgi:hypothetical protein
MIISYSAGGEASVGNGSICQGRKPGTTRCNNQEHNPIECQMFMHHHSPFGQNAVMVSSIIIQENIEIW